MAFSFNLFITAFSNTLLFDGFAADGAFQLMNPLRRLAAGQAIGNDFNFFHGIGVPLIHLPFYYLFGQGLFGSEIARWLVSPGVFVASAFVFFYVLKRRFAFAFTMTTLVTGLGMLVVPFLVLPLTSLLGVRSFVPVLLMALMLKQAALRRPVSEKYVWTRRINLYELLAGLLLALSFICGTEFGLGAILAFALANTLYRTDSLPSWRARFWSTARVMAMGGVLTLALFTIITRGTPLTPITFALKDVPADQFWYFGVPPNSFLFHGNLLDTFFSDGRLQIMLGIGLAAAVLVLMLHRLKSYRYECQAYIYGLLAGTLAMVSMFGYYNNSEASALTRMGLLITAAAGYTLFMRWRKPLKVIAEFHGRKRSVALTPAGGVRLLAVVFLAMVAYAGVHAVHSTFHYYDVHMVLARTKSFLLARDTNVLGADWRNVDAGVMPVIQADNTIPVADVNDGGFAHGVQANQVVLQPGAYRSFVRRGQLVYFAKSGRQIIRSTADMDNGRVKVTLQNTTLQLDPQHDTAPLIFAEDFKHNNKKVWTLYSGLITQEMGDFHPSQAGYDYIIHALGPDRRKEYVDEFTQTKPEFVLTLTRPYFRYEEWVQNAHWDFYSLLDQNYEVVKQSSIYNVWKRRSAPWSDTHRQTEGWHALTVNQAERKIILPMLDFTTVPDLESLGIAQQQAQLERDRALGRDLHPPVTVSEEAYNQFKLDEIRGRRQYELERRENSGAETDAAEQAAWLEAARAHPKRNPFPVQPPEGEYHVARPKRQVILVHIKYQTSHAFSGVPFFGKTTRYLLEPNNTYSGTPVSLRPYENELTFPLVISEYNKNPYLRLSSYSMLPGKGVLKITSAQWMPLATSDTNLQALTD